MRHRLLPAAAVLLLLSLCFGAGTASAGPIDFLKRLGRSIVHPHHAEQPTRKTKAVHRKTAKRSEPTPTETATPAPATATPASSPAPATATPSMPSPTPLPVRAAGGVPATNKAEDLPYGVPVPNRPGLVTSPYAPSGGYVDVRGYPSGTEVRDPYTGKIFRTP